MYYPLINSVEVSNKIKSILDTLGILQFELSELYEDLALPKNQVEQAAQPGALFIDDNAGPVSGVQITDPEELEIIARLQTMERRHNRQLANLSGAIMRVVEMAGLQDGPPQQEKRIGFKLTLKKGNRKHKTINE